MIRRYEEGFEVLEKSDIETAITLATEVLDWARKVCL